MQRPHGIPQHAQTEPSHLPADSRPPFHRHAIILIAVAALTIGLILAADRAGVCQLPDLCGALVADDILQGRLDVAPPAPRGPQRLEQTLVPRRDGLTEIELLLVRYDPLPENDEGRLKLELLDDRGSTVISQVLETRELVHNQTFHLRFPPQPDSAGRRYTLRLSGDDANHFSAWGYSVDVYSGGVLELGPGPAGDEPVSTDAKDLRFISRYALTFGEGLNAALAPLEKAGLTVAALLLLMLPGSAALVVVWPRGRDRGAWLGVALASGVAAWPIIWEWVSLAGGRLSGIVLWAALAIGWSALAIIAYRRLGAGSVLPVQLHVAARPARPSLYPLLLVLLLLAAIASRFVAVRDLAYPPWVDSSRHALITAVMAENGRTPENYDPYLPVDNFPYHFGFHTLSTSLYLMMGWPLAELLLFFMQLLGGLLPLTVYAGGWLVTRQRSVGLLAAFLVALPFFFPGYYATWGRMTQLAAMMVMPVLLATTWRLGRGWSRVWPLVGMLAAGLFLIHFRVFLFYLVFAALLFVADLLGRRSVTGLAKAALLGALLVMPQAVHLLGATEPAAAVRRSLPGYNDFPAGYVTTGWERAYLLLAAAALLVVLSGVISRRRWARFPFLLAIWVGALFILLAGKRLGLPETLVVNLNSMYITLFLPLAFMLAIVAQRLWSWAGRFDRLAGFGRAPSVLKMLIPLAGGVAVGLLALFGWRQQINIINPQTVLALPEDEAALAWVGDNLPPDAKIAVNAWQWLGATWAGSDGGAWIVPLTGLQTTTPPVDHIYNRELFTEVQDFNAAASAVEDWSEPEMAGWLAAQGVTHVFVGQRGGTFDPAELTRNPAMTVRYHQGGVFVFETGTDDGDGRSE